jgi:hypothetical protein
MEQQNYGWRHPANRVERRIRAIVCERLLPTARGSPDYWVRRVLKESADFATEDEVVHSVLDFEIERQLSRGREPSFKPRYE